MPTVTKVSWNAPSTVSTPSLPISAVNPPSKAPAHATPRLNDNCATTDSKLLPLLALASSRSISVTVFIAVNCSELIAPRIASRHSSNQYGVCSLTRPMLASMIPSARVLPVSTMR
ncbi:hypothetical protein D3C81_1759380 [compost metagenome]